MSIRSCAIIDYGVGNIRSVSRVIEATQLANGDSINVVITRDHKTVLDSDLIVLPGVGSFGAASEQLGSWRDELVGVIKSGTPTIGMCLGMQLMFEKSEEGSGDGLGLISGVVTKLTSKRVPHMGWNEILGSNGQETSVPWAYFAHSYACRPENEEVVKGWTSYQGDNFASIVRVENILGTQFHPEKSDLAGVALVHDFVSEVLS